jgi:transcriptional/translational regulatory protein YebC/TACO1
MAVKAGGGPDLEKNRQLAQVIADAKVNNVPRDVIERQLSKAKDATTIGESLSLKC